MAASNESSFDTRSGGRILDEFRATNSAVEAVFRTHRDYTTSSSLNRQTVEDALAHVNHAVCLVLDRDTNTEYLHYANGGWWSTTDTPTGTVGPIQLYQHNVTDRLTKNHPLTVERTDQTPFAHTTLGEHDLDAAADGVMVDD